MVIVGEIVGTKKHDSQLKVLSEYGKHSRRSVIADKFQDGGSHPNAQLTT